MRRAQAQSWCPRYSDCESQQRSAMSNFRLWVRLLNPVRGMNFMTRSIALSSGTMPFGPYASVDLPHRSAARRAGGAPCALPAAIRLRSRPVTAPPIDELHARLALSAFPRRVQLTARNSIGWRYRNHSKQLSRSRRPEALKFCWPSPRCVAECGLPMQRRAPEAPKTLL